MGSLGYKELSAYHPDQCCPDGYCIPEISMHNVDWDTASRALAFVKEREKVARVNALLLYAEATKKCDKDVLLSWEDVRDDVIEWAESFGTKEKL